MTEQSGSGRRGLVVALIAVGTVVIVAVVLLAGFGIRSIVLERRAAHAKRLHQHVGLSVASVLQTGLSSVPPRLDVDEWAERMAETLRPLTRANGVRWVLVYADADGNPLPLAGGLRDEDDAWLNARWQDEPSWPTVQRGRNQTVEGFRGAARTHAMKDGARRRVLVGWVIPDK